MIAFIFNQNFPAYFSQIPEFYSLVFDLKNTPFSPQKQPRNDQPLTNSLEVQLNFIFKSFHCLSAISKSALSKIFIEQSEDLHIALDWELSTRESTATPHSAHRSISLWRNPFSFFLLQCKIFYSKSVLERCRDYVSYALESDTSGDLETVLRLLLWSIVIDEWNP